jgi:DNA repair protein RadC
VTSHPPIYETLSDVDLVRRLIGHREARKFYRGSLGPLFSPSRDGQDPPERCLVARELVNRWLKESLKRGPIFSSPTAVRDYLRIYFAHREYESFVTLFLDAQNQLIESEESFRGTLTQTSVYPREIVKAALRHNAAAVIFSHNHPSGIAEPSRADEMLTTALKQALALVDVKDLDHFVVGAQSAMSFADRGLL